MGRCVMRFASHFTSIKSIAILVVAPDAVLADPSSSRWVAWANHLKSESLVIEFGTWSRVVRLLVTFRTMQHSGSVGNSDCGEWCIIAVANSCKV